MPQGKAPHGSASSWSDEGTPRFWHRARLLLACFYQKECEPAPRIHRVCTAVGCSPKRELRNMKGTHARRIQIGASAVSERKNANTVGKHTMPRACAPMWPRSTLPNSPRRKYAVNRARARRSDGSSQPSCPPPPPKCPPPSSPRSATLSRTPRRPSRHGRRKARVTAAAMGRPVAFGRGWRQ